MKKIIFVKIKINQKIKTKSPKFNIFRNVRAGSISSKLGVGSPWSSFWN